MSGADSLAALGLADNPFAAGALPDFYFVGGQRRFLLQQAMHGLYIARSIVLICGERGAGKTHLLTALRAELDGLMDCCEIAASVLMDGGTIRRQLTELLRLPIECAVDNGTLTEALARQVPAEVEPLPVALLIDDAQELAVPTLAELQQLVGIAQGRIRLLLAGEATLVSAWQQLPVAAAELLELQPLDLQESADYLQTRLQAAGWRGALPLAPEQMQKLYRSSGGCIGRLDELAPAALANAEASDGSVSPAAGRRIPWRWIAAAAGVLLLTFAGISLLDDGEPESESASLDGQPAGARTTVVLPLSVESEDVPTAAESADTSVLSEPARRVAVPAPLPGAASPSSTNTGVSNNVAVAPPSVESPASKAPAATPKTEAKAAPAPLAERTAAPTAVAPAVRPQPTTTSSSAQSASYRFDEQKLLALAPEAVVLQLMASGSHEAVRTFMRVNAATTPALLVEARRSGKPWFVLVTGPFADKATALAAISTLPEPLRKLKPWPRSAASVQSDVRAAHGGS